MNSLPELSLSAPPRCVTPRKAVEDILEFASMRHGNSGHELALFTELLTRTAGQQDQCNVYGLLVNMIRSWAAKADTSGCDGYIIEECRCICKSMGWAPAYRLGA